MKPRSLDEGQDPTSEVTAPSPFHSLESPSPSSTLEFFFAGENAMSRVTRQRDSHHEGAQDLAKRDQVPINAVVSMGRRNTGPKSNLQVFQRLNSFESADSKKTLPCLGLIEYSPKDQVSLKNTIGSAD